MYEDKIVSASELFPLIKEQLKTGKATFYVSGRSMWPFMGHNRDSVIIEACTPDQIRVLDIILFRTIEGKYYLHRVIRLDQDSFTTLGDGCLVADEPQPRQCVMGRVIKIKRKGKVIDCGKRQWRFLFRLWRIFWPIRGFLIKVLVRLPIPENKDRKQMKS